MIDGQILLFPKWHQICQVCSLLNLAAIQEQISAFHQAQFLFWGGTSPSPTPSVYGTSTPSSSDAGICHFHRKCLPAGLCGLGETNHHHLRTTRLNLPGWSTHMGWGHKWGLSILVLLSVNDSKVLQQTGLWLALSSLESGVAQSLSHLWSLAMPICVAICDAGTWNAFERCNFPIASDGFSTSLKTQPLSGELSGLGTTR